MNFKVRPAQADDLLEMHQVFLAAWLDTYPNDEFNIRAEDIRNKFDRALSRERIADRRKQLTEGNDHKLALVALADDKIVGVCRAVKEPEYNQLQAIYVLPEYQRVGLGQMMWAQIVKFFDIEKETIVHVASYNDKAINFYKKLGFAAVGSVFFDEKHKLDNGAMIPEIKMVIEAGKIVFHS